MDNVGRDGRRHPYLSQAKPQRMVEGNGGQGPGAMSLRTKIIVSIVALTLLLGLGGTIHARVSLTTIIREQLEERGIAIARDLAARSADLLLTNDVFSLYELVNDTLVNNDDVRYIFIVDATGKVRVHSFEKGLPKGLPGANRVSPDERYSVKAIATQEGIIHDVAVPIFEGKAGTARVGMSERFLQERVNSFTVALLMLTAVVLVLGVGVAYALATLLTKPLLQLVEVTKAVGKGDLTRKAPVRSQDEIGRLGFAFNAMTEDLARSKQRGEEFNRQLLRRNEELSALNAISATVSRSLNLEEVLEGALGKVLELMKLRAGWIFLWDAEQRNLNLVSHRGLSSDFVQEEAKKELDGCACAEVLKLGETRIVEDLSTCPRLSREAVEREGLTTHACVPLKSKERVLGIINIASDDQHRFSEDELRLLTSIGHQIGMAIENARLYEELQRKEVLRGHLLEKAISAQEEERKRIARELHDESAQALTALAMSLEATENQVPPELAQVRETLGRTRRLATHALAEARKLILDLRPTALDDLGLVPAIRWYAESHLEPLGVKVEVEASSMKRLPPEMETALFRIAQETVNNVAKHAQATEVRIYLGMEDTTVVGIIEDNGQGFNMDQVLRSEDKTRCLGILGIRERVALFGGTMDLWSQPGRGTRLSLRVPLNSGGNRQ